MPSVRPTNRYWIRARPDLIYFAVEEVVRFLAAAFHRQIFLDCPFASGFATINQALVT